MFAVLSLQDIVECYLELCDYVKFFLVSPGCFSATEPRGYFIYLLCVKVIYILWFVREVLR